MAFLDKLNSLASAAGEKASGAIELGRLNLRLGAEEKKIETATFQMGATLLSSLDAGAQHDAAIMALYEDIQLSRAELATLRTEIATLSGHVICASCSEKNPQDSKFCRACGVKLLEVENAPAAPACNLLACPTCGHVSSEDESFCNHCGTKLD